MLKTENENKICSRCGNCCIDVGRTFWKSGLLDPDIWDDCGDLKERAYNGDHEDGGLPCEMLLFDDERLAACFIEKVYGYEKKPKVCRDHEGDERCEPC